MRESVDTSITESNELETLFLQQLEHVRRVTEFLCRRCGFAREDADDCLSWVQLKLIEDHYAVLRSFRHDSSVRTFLTAVVAMLVRDYRVARFGRWRPSAEARRRGPIAVRLETLVYRDHVPLRAALQQLRTEGLLLSDHELVDVFRAIPRRDSLRPKEIPAEVLDAIGVGAASPEATLTSADREDVDRTLMTMVGELDLEDRTAIQLHFFEGVTVADIARGLRVPQKPLYRRMQRLLGKLRHRLEDAGVSRDRALAALHETDS